ncbi:LacI family DNA-binding transcriptional regulator [Acerihabitans arboris]|uniref:LacI family DNA-binding transcriptional regulator n=1 Tax=Acerihabitans arboris TaxID=2691583 RepID=A0A845SY23_9GAMM|nr:LacI family DNA-binding transcriptional regulator [Acerihabitans arboris]NDL65755.1 LacI family DNA-binding transcriptional regulator [Acerihabitans arboris]
MKPKNATLDDVARHAGVSYQTVSRVLNRSAHVAEPTRLRVEQAIGALNYVPNRMAQQLAGRRSPTLGLVTTSLGFHAPSQIASAIELHANQLGFTLLIAMVDAQRGEGVQAALNELKAQRVDGVILNLPLEAAQAEEVVNRNPDLSCLFLDVPPDAGVFHVMFNPDDGTRASVDHLYRLGHRRFGLLSGPLSSVSARLRLHSWQRSLKEYGLDPVEYREGDWSAESGYCRALEMTRNADAFSALLVGNDQMALGVFSALSRQQIGVPAQISVIGYDDTRDSAFFLPPLTTVSQDFNRLGREAVTRLVAHLGNGGRESPASMMLPTHLVARNSTARPDDGGTDYRQLAEQLARIAARLRQ